MACSGVARNPVLAHVLLFVALATDREQSFREKYQPFYLSVAGISNFVKEITNSVYTFSSE